ncbi:MAG TPA: tetratricopeptide repeat protein [Candidatus Obscuribacterales bacterium]
MRYLLVSIRAICAFPGAVHRRLRALSDFIDELLEDALEDLPEMLRELAGSYGKLREETPEERHERLLKQFIKRDRILFGKKDRYCARSLMNLADFYRSRRRLGEAEQYYVRALEILELHLRCGDPALSEAYSKVAGFYRQYAQDELSATLYRKAIAGKAKQFGEDAPELVPDLRGLAEACLDMRRYEEALEAYLRELAIKEKALGPSHPELCAVLAEILRAFREASDASRAERYKEQLKLIEAVNVVEGGLGREHRAVAAELERLAAFYRKDGKYDFCRLLEERARLARLADKVRGGDYPGLVRDLRELADLYERRNEPGDATAAFRLRARADHIVAIRRERGKNADISVLR